MSVYKITLGTPEELVPTKFSPKSKIEVTPVSLENAKELHFKKTARGLLVEFPLNPGNEVYGFGLQLKGFCQTNRKKTIRPNADPISNTGDSHAPVPFFVTTEGWGIFVDTARYVEFNCGYTKVSTTSTAEHSELKSEFADIYAKREVSYPTVFTID
ncbi:MAG: hypothetical protein IJX08_04550, partial [Clostridia bacterium]|nr:hypothetical protein [Clostridia bacterium]